MNDPYYRLEINDGVLTIKILDEDLHTLEFSYLIRDLALFIEIYESSGNRVKEMRLIGPLDDEYLRILKDRFPMLGRDEDGRG